MRRRSHDPACMACGTAALPRWKRLCDRCWALLPGARRRAIAEAMSAKNYGLVARLSAEARDWLKEHSPVAEAARMMGERV